jgi:hypothetical protein
MIGITRQQIKKMQTAWKRNCEKIQIVPQAFMEHIGKRGHQQNQAAKAEEGGRIIRKLLADMVESPTQKAVTERMADLKSCTWTKGLLDGVDPQKNPADSPQKMEVSRRLQ